MLSPFSPFMAKRLGEVNYRGDRSKLGLLVHTQKLLDHFKCFRTKPWTPQPLLTSTSHMYCCFQHRKSSSFSSVTSLRKSVFFFCPPWKPLSCLLHIPVILGNSLLLVVTSRAFFFLLHKLIIIFPVDACGTWPVVCISLTLLSQWDPWLNLLKYKKITICVLI